jgi:hypothetical protein
MSFNSPFTGQVIQPTDVSYRSIVLATDQTLSWPINGSATDNAAARIMDVDSLSSGLPLSGVTVVGTGGECSCSSVTGLFIGQAIAITGTNSGSSAGIVPGNTYYIIATNTTTTFTLSATLGGPALATTAGTTTGLTFTLDSFILAMPPANQASVGIDALFRNTGSYSFTVTDYNGNSIVAIAAGQAKYVYLTENATTAGSWEVISFGVGASNVDASALAGYGLKAISSTLNAAHNVSTFSSSYTAIASDRASSYVWTGGAGTLSLTSAITLGNDWFMLVRNNGTGTLAVTPIGGILINGSGSISLQPADSCVICCSGSAFFTVGLGRSTQFNFTQLTKAVTSGTYTLTASEAANTIQKYTGVLTGNVTVIIPPTVQVYYITNQTDGGGSGYTITFTTNTGGATATVPASQQVILLCDSVNLLNASTVAVGATTFSLINGTAGAPALNFAAETSTGIYRPGSGEFGISILGVQLFGLTATGLNVPGLGNFTGGVQGGTF